MKMTGDDYRRFVCIVAGDNPDELMAKYDSKLNSERHLVYKFADAEKLKEQYLKMYEKIIESKSTSEFDRKDVKETYEALKHTSSDDFYFDLTIEYELDEETGDAYSTKNDNGKWEEYGSNKLFAVPFSLLNGETCMRAKKNAVDWPKMHRHGVATYLAAWETVMEGRKPANIYEEQIYRNMKDNKGYLNKFGTKENYVSSCTSFWGYAFLSKETGWIELEPNVDQFNWMNNFYDRFIEPLDGETTLTIFECRR